LRGSPPLADCRKRVGEGHAETDALRVHARSYISTRHLGGSNLCFADGHAESMKPKQVYQDNRYWNGLGGENLERDPHVPYKHLDGEWRFPGI